MAYSEKVIDHAENPRNVGTLDKSDPNVGTGLVGAPACGDVMRLQLKISDFEAIPPALREDGIKKNLGLHGHSMDIFGDSRTPAVYSICYVPPPLLGTVLELLQASKV